MAAEVSVNWKHTLVDAMDLVNSNDEAEVAIEDEDDIDDTAFESEKCGICTDVVIDRGVLDCCSHWFCFACIDNWAAITNLCPLCKNEFQLITCLPVYDTIGTTKVEEHSFPRDDDWCIQGNNNTLSFPSYYIDENAVICLDGDGCKIRSGLVTSDEDLTYDTSIACDSCDIWYHAFCVGFDAECTSEISWLCPRCITNDLQQKAARVSMQNLGTHSALRSADLGWISDSSFSGKVSVSVADTGETAVVISMIEGEQNIEFSKRSEMKVDSNSDNQTEPDAVSGNAKLDVLLDKSARVELMRSNMICNDEKGSITNSSQSKNSPEIVWDIPPEMADVQPDVVLREKSLEAPLLAPSLQDAASEMTKLQQYNSIMDASSSLSLSQDAPLSSPCNLVTPGVSKANSTEETISNPCNSDGYRISSPQPFKASATFNGLSEDKSLINPPLGFPVASSSSSSSVDEEVNDALETHMVRSSECPSKFSSLSANKMVTGISEDMVDITLQENCEVNGRKLTENSQSHGINVDHVNNHTRKRERHLQVKTESDCSAKKAKSDRKSQILPSRSQVNTSVSENSQICFSTAAVPTKANLRYVPEKQAIAADILSIVQETDQGSQDDSAGTKSVGRAIVKRDNAAGLRVKKIMRRAGDKKESSILVQKLRREIREAVQDKSSNIGKDNAFDTKLLTAFRAAIVKPSGELASKFDPSLARVKNSSLQKGKVRENLTKKIYGTSTGRRRRAWDRDWDIEFWKHRCTRIKPEKVETLQSVLELLKKATNCPSENSDMDQGPEGETINSILSRVYLADASVFPRKDDIKPLSAIEGCYRIDNLEQHKENSSINLSKKDSQSVHENNMEKRLIGASMVSSQDPSFDNTGKKNCTSREASSTKGNLDAPRSRPTPISGSCGSKGRKQNSEEMASQSGSAKIDKKKWALEVLARKNALINSNMNEENQEDISMLKENYPLLAQLPTDMRPMLPPSRHNKIHVSVRQAQLYRITEHYLRRTNLLVMQRTADTELAVADAINVEKEIFERSNSKLVYVNLCSQFLSQLAKKPRSAETIARQSSAAFTEGNDRAAEEASSNHADTECSKVEEALRLAGLSSDSPPNSPYRPANGPDEEDETPVNIREDALENVLDIATYTELDIYGDFEYDLEDEGYIDSTIMASALKVSKVQPENGDSRIKVVLSTRRGGGSDNFLDSEHDTPKLKNSEAAMDGHENSETVRAPSDPSTVLECSPGDTTVEVRKDVHGCLEPSRGEVYKEASLAECEELYGPEKEPLVNRIPSSEMIGEPNNMKMARAGSSLSETEHCRSKDGTTVSEFETQSCTENISAGVRPLLNYESHGREKSPHSMTSENSPEERVKSIKTEFSNSTHSISKKVEAYVKEHIRPLCISGVISVEQYRWAAGKTIDKVMKYHYKAKNANFLIKGGEKVKKLAEQYVEAAQQKKLE